MGALEIDRDLLYRFEGELDPRRPQRGRFAARLLGYGEISTVFALDEPGAKGWAFKRMPMFRNDDEARAYESLHRHYVTTLVERVGLNVAPSGAIHIVHPGRRHATLYIAQPELPAHAIGHRILQRLSPEEVTRLVWAVLQEMHKLFEFNRANKGRIELGLDGQISNWCVEEVSAATGGLPAEIRLTYLDTSTPLMRVNGQEQLDPELLLRSAPSFMLGVVRRAFLPEVMTRYYYFGRVATDLVANFLKEGRMDLVPSQVDVVNRFFSERWAEADFKPLTVKAVRDYYRFDALIWRVYLALRKFDRVLAGISQREYPYILPERIAR
jgi:hypothetical protein